MLWKINKVNTSKTSDKALLKGIPTNIISGFLGVGKTSAVLSLLATKPKNERWAVLVNEFGEIGIDGQLLTGNSDNTQGVYVREVPGGCMCCAAGLPMQIALNQLLAKARPHRLLIEPTGLGHPKEVLEVLLAPHYRDVLDIQKTVTLLDPRKLKDPRYTNHDTFNQQIDIADVVVGNKQDLYGSSEKAQMIDYLDKRANKDLSILFTQQGKLDPSILKGPSHMAQQLSPVKSHAHTPKNQPNVNELPLPTRGVLAVENSGEGFKSLGWRFSPDKIFSKKLVFGWLSKLSVERLKAVLITDEGIFGYNLVDDTLTVTELDDCFESRMEIIALEVHQDWEEDILNCQIVTNQSIFPITSNKN